METTLGILTVAREQQLTTALITFGNSEGLNFFAASSQFNGSVPSNGFEADRLTAIGPNEQQQIADFIVGQNSNILSYAGSDRAASSTFPAQQNANSTGAIGPDTYPLTGMRTASQLNFPSSDNTLATARNVAGVENGRVNLNDFVGVGDTDDYYRFTINSNSDLSLRIDALTGNAGIELIQDKNRNGRTDYNVAAGIRYAADNGANVINISLGDRKEPVTSVDEAIQYANNKGVVVIMAAGNALYYEPLYPAINAARWGIAVGGIDRNNKMYESSNRAGMRPLDYVVAPAVEIVSTTPYNTYKTYKGTSMATPHVAGVAALVLNANPTLTPAQVEYTLTKTANSNGVTV